MTVKEFSINPVNSGIDYLVQDALPRFPLGQKSQSNLGTTYRYVAITGTNALAQGFAGVIDNTFTINNGVPGAATSFPLLIGIPQMSGGLTAPGSGVTNYGWVAVEGVIANVQVTASAAANVPIYTNATAGLLTDATTTAHKIDGLKLTSARAASQGNAPGQAACEMRVIA